MARLVAGMGTSHVPGVGAAMDNGKTDEPYWAKSVSYTHLTLPTILLV